MVKQTPKTDRATADLVRAGLAMKRAFGLPAGIALLRRHSVDAQLAARVLARKYDQRG